VGLRDSYSIPTIGSGKVKVNTQESNGEKVVRDVLYVLTYSLFSAPLKATHLDIESARTGGLLLLDHLLQCLK